MSFEIKPNRIDSEAEIVALIEANAPIPSAADLEILNIMQAY
jgi:hypothetical protein